jgi:biotin carboxyl carrier protein
MIVATLGNGVYRVEEDGHVYTVYVAGPPGDRWAFCRGDVFREVKDRQPDRRGQSAERGAHVAQPLSAPMPATVIKLMARPGAAVRKGETLLVLEAMKMELPLRAPADAVVTAVHCREGDLVQPDTILMELQ